MSSRPPEPRRVPPTPAASDGERYTAGCLGLFLLPWFLSTLFGTVVSAGLPLSGLEGALIGGLNLVLLTPMAAILGSVTMSAIARALGSSEPIRIMHRAGIGLAVSAIFLFMFSVISSLGAASTVGILPIFVGAAVFILLGTLGSMAVKTDLKLRKSRKARKRKQHDSPPKPPWAHPLARTEKLNMYGEALADEVSVVAVVTSIALSVLVGNPLPMLVVGGLELIWLALAPDSKWFRGRVERKHIAMADDQARDLRAEQREFLATDQLVRHEEMVERVARTIKTLETAGFAFDQAKLDRAIDHHLWLMQLENYYGDLDTARRTQELDKQLAAARADTEGMSGRMLEVLARRVDVLERRHAQILEMEERTREVADQRRTLEETLLLVAEAALAGPTSLAEIDEVLLDLQVTEEVVLDLHDDEDALEQEIEEAYAVSVEAAG